MIYRSDMTEKETALIKEHQDAINAFKKLIARKAKLETIRYHAKVIISINEDILTAICGGKVWKPGEGDFDSVRFQNLISKDK